MLYIAEQSSFGLSSYSLQDEYNVADNSEYFCLLSHSQTPVGCCRVVLMHLDNLVSARSRLSLQRFRL